MLEGDWDGHEKLLGSHMFTSDVLLEEREVKFMNLIQSIDDSVLDRYEEKLQTVPWMFEAWVSLDRCVTSNERSGENGSTLLHITIMNNASKTLIYLIYILIVRDRLRARKLEKQKDSPFKMFQVFEEVINYRNKLDLTPLLCAAKYDNYEAFRLIF
jgi:hypothetical protein